MQLSKEKSMETKDMTAAEIDKAILRGQQEMDAFNVRLEGIKAGFADDVQRLHDLAQERTGAGSICQQILQALHQKSGSVDLFELRHLDVRNKSAALRLVELCATPSLLSDAGLAGILTEDEVEALFADTPTLEM
jgi:hypothetical protein